MTTRTLSSQDDQPFIEHWPMSDEALSKVTAPLDIETARWRLACRFNARRPKIPPAILERQIDRAWCRHHSNKRSGT